jgi:hypothetical protein
MIKKHKKFYDFLNKNQENINNSYNFNNNNKSIDFNINYIKQKQNIKQQEAKCFNSYSKSTKNRKLIIIKTISEKLRKPLNLLEQNNQNLNSNTNLKNNKLKNFVRASRIFNKKVISYIKSKGLKSILFV